MTDLETDLMDLCKLYSRALERLESENKELGLEVHALWEKQNQLEAENAVLKRRLQSLEQKYDEKISITNNDTLTIGKLLEQSETLKKRIEELESELDCFEVEDQNNETIIAALKDQEQRANEIIKNLEAYVDWDKYNTSEDFDAFCRIRAENEALQARVKELETPDCYLEKKENNLELKFISDGYVLNFPLMEKAKFTAAKFLEERFFFKTDENTVRSYKTREEAQAALEALKNE